MISYKIPDPFVTFVSNKYKNYTGLIYDYFTREWSWKCTCNDMIYAPNKKTMTKIRLYHTRNECTGGY